MTRVARPIEDLFDQVNATAPGRSKASDGTIGDSRHAATKSDHNPRKGWVHAGDVTHDPKRFDVHAWMRRLTSAGLVPECVKYFISNDQIWDENRGWRPYQPTNRRRNQHRKHGHISVKDGCERLTGVNWHTNINRPMRPAPTSEPTPKPPAPKPKPQEEDDMVVIDKKSRAVIVLTKTHWRNVNKNRDHYIGMAELTHTKIPEWTDTQIKAWIKSESLIELPPA